MWTALKKRLKNWRKSKPWGKMTRPGYIYLHDTINPPIDITHEEIEAYKAQERKGLLRERNARQRSGD
jgi:hypothetical protein